MHKVKLLQTQRLLSDEFEYSGHEKAPH